MRARLYQCVLAASHARQHRTWMPCAGGGSRTSRVLARHCRMEFMKHVLPRLDRPLGMDGPRGTRYLDADSELGADGGVRVELRADVNDVDVDGLDVELVLRSSDGVRWVLS